MSKAKPNKRKPTKMAANAIVVPSPEQQLMAMVKAHRRLFAQAFDDWFAESIRDGGALDAASTAEAAVAFLRQRQAGVIPEHGVAQADRLFIHLATRISRNSA